MVVELLEAKLSATDNLSDKLDDVAESAAAVGEALDQAEDKMDSIARSSAATANNLDRVSDKLLKTLGSAKGMGGAAESAANDLSELSISLEGTDISLDSTQNSSRELMITLYSMADAIDQAEEQMGELSNSQIRNIASTLSLSSSQKELMVQLFGTSKALDSASDETEEFADELLEASGAAGIFGLSSTALSINVGAFTVALRNATTQIPALVAVLGNLGGAFLGVASTAGLAAAGIGGVLAGGLLAEVESLSGGFQDMEKSMAAFRAVGEELLDMFLESLQPLIEMQGAAEAFQSIMEGLANTIHVFSQGLAASFEAGKQMFGIKDFMDEIGSAWSSNLNEIVAGFTTLFHNIGPVLADMIVFAINNFQDFAMAISDVTLDMAALFRQLQEPVGDFVGEMVNLGSVLAAGVIPVVITFLNIMTAIVKEINELNPEVVALTVQLGGLLLLVSKLSGTIATAVGLTGALGSAFLISSDNADTFSQGVKSAMNSIGSFVEKSDSGLAQLSNSFAKLIPLANDLDEDAGFGDAIFSGLGSAKKSVVGVFGDIKSTAQDTADNLFEALVPGAKLDKVYSDVDMDVPIDQPINSLGRFRERLSSVRDGIKSYIVNSRAAAAANKLYSAATQKLANSKVVQFITTKLANSAIVRYIKTAFGATAAESLWNTITISLTASLGALAAILGSVVIIGGALVAALALLGTQSEQAKSAFDGLLDGLKQIASAAMPIFITSANMLVDILKAVLAPVFAIKDGILTLAQTFGLIKEGGNSFDLLSNAISAIGAVINPVMGFIGDLARLIGGVLTVYIDTLVAIIDTLAKVFLNVWDIILSPLGGLEGVLGGIVGLFEDVVGFFSKVPAIAASAWNPMADIIDNFSIDIPLVGEWDPKAPRIGGGGGKSGGMLSDSNIKQSDVNKGVSAASEMASRSAESRSPQTTNPNITYDEGDTNNNYNQNIQADPDEKGQLSRTVKDAIEEANSFRRYREGHGG